MAQIMIHLILEKLTKKFEWTRQGIERTDQWKNLSVGDLVEYSIQFSDGIRYRITAINYDTDEAKIQRLDADGNGHETYDCAPVMLRPVSA